MNRIKLTLTIVLLMCFTLTLQAATKATITVHADKPGVTIADTMYGVFFEDINFAADGGLYGELVKNRSFEFPKPMMGWYATTNNEMEGAIKIADNAPFTSKNPHYIVINANKEGFGAVNAGFRGIGVRDKAKYRFSAMVRKNKGAVKSLTVTLMGQGGAVLAQKKVNKLSDDWKKHTVILKAKDTEAKATLHITCDGEGTVALDMVSLFPVDTWNKRPNGMRKDLVHWLADLDPGFVRFPGGCIVEGHDLSLRYQWKTTIGKLEDRVLIKNRWNDEFQHRLTPDYYQSFGLGYYEYFQLSEDLGAEPLPIMNCGMACQFNTGELVPLDELEPYIQDVIDLIEFANGPADSHWGKIRAEMGHPKPFNLKYVGIGNEQWGQQFIDRYAIFHKVLKEKHPEIILISTAGPGGSGGDFNLAWREMTKMGADIIDEHQYAQPRWFLEQTHRYDNYNRQGPKAFMGEYAGHGRSWESSLAEAAFMTGMERNADIVTMSAYAPLFAHVDGWQWRPDLIWFDNLRSVGTVSYYVQKLFSTNRGKVTCPYEIEAKKTMDSSIQGGIGVGTWVTQAEYKDIKVVKPDGKVLFESDFSKGKDGWRFSQGEWAVVDGALRQTNRDENARAMIGDVSWGREYTLTLKARKIGGDEGFLVMFQMPNDGVTRWWNLGGWRNSLHGLEGVGRNPQVAGKIETDKWYDIRIELKDAKVSCYLDGKLIQQEAQQPLETLHAAVSLTENGKEMILKVVNTGSDDCETTVNLNGLKRVKAKATAWTMCSDNLDAQNTVDEPTVLVPVKSTVKNLGESFTHTFPAHSVTVLRIGVKK